MNIIIVGAGKVGLTLTRQLLAEHRITLIDQNAQLIDNIVNIYDVLAVCGNGASYEVQTEAEAAKADLLIATTTSDEINILACLVAKKLGVRHTIATFGIPNTKSNCVSCAGNWGCRWRLTRRKSRRVKSPGFCVSPPL